MSKPDKLEVKKRLNPNPQIKDVEIGIFDLRKLKIYPLSMADQMELTEDINEVVTSFFQINEEEDNEAAFAAFFINLIKDNIPKILESITYNENIDEVLKQLTNQQAADIAKIVFDVNYESVLKNLQSLFGTAVNILQSERPSPQSASIMEDTDSSTSLDSATKKEE